MNLIEKVWFKCPNCGRYQMTIYDNNVVRCNEHKCQYADSVDIYLSNIAGIDVDDAYYYIVEHGLRYGKNKRNKNHQLVFKSSFLNILRDVYFAQTVMHSSDIGMMAVVYVGAATNNITQKMIIDVSEMNICELSYEEWSKFSVFAEEMMKDWDYAGFKRWMKNL